MRPTSVRWPWARGYTFESVLALLGVAGGVIGSLLVSTWGGLKHKRVYGVLVPMLVASVLQIIYGLSPLVLLSAATAALGAAMHPILNAHSQSIWQSHTPRELQGRVFWIRRLIAWTILPISTAAGGALAGILDPGHVLASLGLMWAVFCVAQLLNPYLLRIENGAPPDATGKQAATPHRDDSLRKRILANLLLSFPQMRCAPTGTMRGDIVFYAHCLRAAYGPPRECHVSHHALNRRCRPVDVLHARRRRLCHHRPE
jgi:MFS family permease